MSIAVWCRYVSYSALLIDVFQRESMNLRLAVALARCTLADAIHVAPLPVLDAVGTRALLGAVCFVAYAGWSSVPILHEVYANLSAAGTVPYGHPYQVLHVHSDGMTPTIPKGAFAVVDFGAYAATQPRIGDVVAVELNPREVFVKRIVARPGDTFSIDAGKVLTNGRTPPGWRQVWSPDYELQVADATIEVDGLPLDRSIARIPLPAAWSDPSRLPNDCYFVLGDNANDSADSHVFGCVPRSAIIGRVARVL